MSNLMTIADCLKHINVLAIDAVKMRHIIDAGDKYPTDLRYQAVVNEEYLLEVITKYIDHITQLKGLSINGTVNNFTSKS